MGGSALEFAGVLGRHVGIARHCSPQQGSCRVATSVLNPADGFSRELGFQGQMVKQSRNPIQKLISFNYCIAGMKGQVSSHQKKKKSPHWKWADARLKRGERIMKCDSQVNFSLLPAIFVCSCIHSDVRPLAQGAITQSDTAHVPRARTD